ncbi:MAG TPA: hypothetical protein VNO79_13960 [Actinomycetota bacterium]|nr:hypothetical protein [Actinomycetota bacterium]
MKVWIECQDGSLLALDQVLLIYVRTRTPELPGMDGGGPAAEVVAISVRGMSWVLHSGTRPECLERLRRLVAQIRTGTGGDVLPAPVRPGAGPELHDPDGGRRGD